MAEAGDRTQARAVRWRARRRGHRLWWRIWLAVVASIVVVALLAVAAWRALFDPTQLAAGGASLAASVAAELPGPGASTAELQAALDRARRRTEADLAVFDPSARPIARAGRPVPPPRADEDDNHWLAWYGHRGPGVGQPNGPAERPRVPAYALHLQDGRWLVVRRAAPPPRVPVGPVPAFVLLALAVAFGTYPIVRRLTRRLERLQASVERLGGGDLTARVAVEGHDEVAQLAASFNRAAARIEELVASHRSLLANASHELRSPLARVRMAVELLRADARPEVAREIARDIAELDALIDEILLMSRLDAQAVAGGAPHAGREQIDLTALVAEECARADASFDAGPQAAPVVLRGEPRLLLRLVRNLLDNARRHGGAPAEVLLAAAGGVAVLSVSDRGPGVAQAERERIFEPFYRARGASEAAGGVGLGLALVRGIAHRHGGEVACLPRDGGGSVFRVTLPLDAGVEESATA
jgi:signal transduction histidine kinase